MSIWSYLRNHNIKPYILYYAYIYIHTWFLGEALGGVGLTTFVRQFTFGAGNAYDLQDNLFQGVFPEVA